MKLKTKERKIETQKENKKALFGGTFNPIHNGHLKMAEKVRKKFNLSKIYFIPCGIPPHKDKSKMLPAKLRLKLLKEAIKGKKYFSVLDLEIKKRKKAYTIETVNELLRKRRILHSKENTHFIIGQDAFEKLNTWYKAEELVEKIRFIVLPRTKKKIKIPKLKNLEYEILKEKPIQISAKEIREKIKAKKNIKNYVPRKIKNILTASMI